MDAIQSILFFQSELTVMLLEYMAVLGNNGRKLRRVWKELCYGNAKTLGDAEEAARLWRYNSER